MPYHECFNTQPPEGGWHQPINQLGVKKCFNTQPPEGGWVRTFQFVQPVLFQHTAARRRLGAKKAMSTIQITFQHTAARRRLVGSLILLNFTNKFQHTAARRRLDSTACNIAPEFMFQHTAARRRLARTDFKQTGKQKVSTHSRPKAAGASIGFSNRQTFCFNTQPPEGGWLPVRFVAVGS